MEAGKNNNKRKKLLYKNIAVFKKSKAAKYTWGRQRQ